MAATLVQFWAGNKRHAFAGLGDNPVPLLVDDFTAACKENYMFLAKSKTYMQWIFPIVEKKNTKEAPTPGPGFWHRVCKMRGCSLGELAKNIILPNIDLMLNFYGYALLGSLKKGYRVVPTFKNHHQLRHVFLCKHPSHNFYVSRIIVLCMQFPYGSLVGVGGAITKRFAIDNAHRIDKPTQESIMIWCMAAGLRGWFVARYLLQKTLKTKAQRQSSRPLVTTTTTTTTNERKTTRSGKQY